MKAMNRALFTTIAVSAIAGVGCTFSNPLEKEPLPPMTPAPKEKPTVFSTRVGITPSVVVPTPDPRYDAKYWAEKYGIKATPPATGGQVELDNAIFGARETLGNYFKSKGLEIQNITGELGDVNAKGELSVLVTGRTSNNEEFLFRNGKITIYAPEQLAKKGLAIAIDATGKETKLWVVDQNDERTFDIFAGREIPIVPPMTYGEIGANGEIKNQVASAKFIGSEAIQMKDKNILRDGDRLVILFADYSEKGEILRIVTVQGNIDFSTNPDLRNAFLFDDAGLRPDQKRVIKPTPIPTVPLTLEAPPKPVFDQLAIVQDGSGRKINLNDLVTKTEQVSVETIRDGITVEFADKNNLGGKASIVDILPETGKNEIRIETIGGETAAWVFTKDRSGKLTRKIALNIPQTIYVMTRIREFALRAYPTQIVLTPEIVKRLADGTTRIVVVGGTNGIGSYTNDKGEPWGWFGIGAQPNTTGIGFLDLTSTP